MARTTTRHTIVVQSSDPQSQLRLEAVGTKTLYPGMLATIAGSGGKLGKHSTKSGASAKLFVLENQTPDTHTYPTTAAIDIPYSTGDTVYYLQARPGDVINARITDGQSVTKGIDWMISGANGRLISCGTGVSVGTSNPVGIAWETVAASGTFARCKVRIV